jgi:hypothetical protein
MTDALCKLGPRAEVTTLRAGELRRLRVDWEECLRNDHFPYLDEERPRRASEIAVIDGISSRTGTRVRIHGQPPGIQLEKLRRLLTERYTPGIWQGREIYVRREASRCQSDSDPGPDWLAIEDMDPGPLTDVIEYDGEFDGMTYHVYGGLMTRRSVVYNRAFIGYSYRFVEETTELVKGLSTAHLQIFLGQEWKECLGTHKNRLERGREELFEDIRSRAKDWLAAAARKAEALQLTSLALELEEYLTRMAHPKGAEVVAPAARAAAGPKGRPEARRRRSRDGGSRSRGIPPFARWASSR